MRVPEHLLQPRQLRLTEDREEERGKRERKRKSDEETALTPVRDSGRGVSSGPPEPNSSEVSLARVFCLQSHTAYVLLSLSSFKTHINRARAPLGCSHRMHTTLLQNCWFILC